jgi:hypothetical protein
MVRILTLQQDMRNLELKLETVKALSLSLIELQNQKDFLNQSCLESFSKHVFQDIEKHTAGLIIQNDITRLYYQILERLLCSTELVQTIIATCGYVEIFSAWAEVKIKKLVSACHKDHNSEDIGIKLHSRLCNDKDVSDTIERVDSYSTFIQDSVREQYLDNITLSRFFYQDNIPISSLIDLLTLNEDNGWKARRNRLVEKSIKFRTFLDLENYQVVCAPDWTVIQHLLGIKKAYPSKVDLNVRIQCKDGVLECSKKILGNISPVWSAMLGGEFEEGIVNDVDLLDASMSVVLLFVSYAMLQDESSTELLDLDFDDAEVDQGVDGLEDTTDSGSSTKSGELEVLQSILELYNLTDKYLVDKLRHACLCWIQREVMRIKHPELALMVLQYMNERGYEDDVDWKTIRKAGYMNLLLNINTTYYSVMKQFCE